MLFFLLFDLIRAVNFFPYAEMHKWMSYGNGNHYSAPAIIMPFLLGDLHLYVLLSRWKTSRM